MITFPEKTSIDVSLVWLRNIFKTYSFMKQKYFAQIDMLYNIPKICYNIY